MQNQTFLTIMEVVGELSMAAIYMGAALITFIVFKQEEFKEWTRNNSNLLNVVIFIVLTQLLYSAGMVFINIFVYLPRRFIVGDSLIASVRCLGGLLALVGLVTGIVIIVRSKE
jgi:hypothetical protein